MLGEVGMGGGWFPCVPEVCSKGLPCWVKYLVSTVRGVGGVAGREVEVGGRVLLVCQRWVAKRWSTLSVQSGVLGWDGGCSPCVPEVGSREVEYHVSTESEVLGGREGVLCVSGWPCPPCCAGGVKQQLQHP